MKEELINNILERLKTLNVKREKLEELDEIVLERLSLIDNNNRLEIILEAILENKLDTFVNIAYINSFESTLTDIDPIFYSNIEAKLKEEALKKAALAKYDFQIEYIKDIYFNSEIKHKDLLTNLILKCSKEFQAYAIYDLIASIEFENKEEYFATYLELAKIITKEKAEYKVDCYYNLDNNKSIVEYGLLLPVAKLISKCKSESQVKNMNNYLSNLDSKNALYVLKNCEYFLRVTDENKLNSLSKYLTYTLKQNLLVEEEKVNLIINARNKFNSDAIEGSLTFGPLIDTDLDMEAAEILNNSRKEYNAKYAKSLVNIGSVEGLSGAMIVNESETRYKAEQVHSIISLYANNDELDKSLEFAALINSVHTKTEIDLIYLLGQNSYLNKLGIALPIARVIADATESEYDVIAIWECLKENKEQVIKGLVTLLKNIDLKNRKKAEDIINMVLIKAQNKPVHFDIQEEKLPSSNKIKTLVNKKLKK